jgi:ATP-dependent Clp protease ATP-binding subunit ClpC
MNLVVPDHIIETEQEIERLQKKKDDLVKAQEYEKAAEVRDEKRQMEEKLAEERKRWEEEEQSQPIQVSTEDIAEVVSMMTGIPVSRVALSESKKLLEMRQELKEKVVGQDQAIDELVKAIRRSRTGLKDPNRPIGSFIFLGPTGVGKTELALVLAEQLFGDRGALIRIDMSEYMEKFNVSRLVGAPPGYVGYDEGGQLSERVRRKPYSVVLLDEVEKAHPDVFNTMLQVLDNGEMTDGTGRRIDFRNTVVIMTSNVGSREAKKGSIGFESSDDGNRSYKEMKSKMLKTAEDMFRPEFLNRIDELIVFRNLEREHILEIQEIYLKEINDRLSERKIELELTDEAKSFIADKGFDRQTGARTLRRAVERHLEDPLAEEMLKGRVTDDSQVVVDFEEDHLVFKPREGKVETARSEE